MIRSVRFTASLLVAAAPAAAFAADAGSPTFYRDILPVLQQKCQECHRPAGANFGGMVAPMSLQSYDEVRPWAKSIVEKITSREMPPWDAAAAFHGVFKNERTLSDEQIALITKWVSAGAPKGDPKDAPEPRVFPGSDGWQFGDPDLVVPIPAPFTIGDEVDDVYTAFEVDLSALQLPKDAWITAFQCKPGTHIIHHFNCHLLPPDADGKLPPKRNSPLSSELAPIGAGQYIGGVSSGTDSSPYPDGFGVPIKKGSRITFDVHYHKEPGAGTAVTDTTSAMGFKLRFDKPPRTIGGVPALMRFDINIPPRDPAFQIGPVSTTLATDVDVLGLMPHAHMRGDKAKFEAIYPDGRREVLLDVPNYDFAWQTVYYYKDIKRLPKGTKVEYTAWYNNSPEMAAVRGFDSEQRVTFGQKSTDEMMMGFMMASPVPADAK